MEKNCLSTAEIHTRADLLSSPKPLENLSRWTKIDASVPTATIAKSHGSAALRLHLSITLSVMNVTTLYFTATIASNSLNLRIKGRDSVPTFVHTERPFVLFLTPGVQLLDNLHAL